MMVPGLNGAISLVRLLKNNTALKTEEYKEEQQQVNNVAVCITTYKIADDYYCHISSVDPGAIISRAIKNYC